MLDLSDEKIKGLLFGGRFGLEKESLRVTADGHMAHTPHLFVENPRISRDFCENQVEINTQVKDSVEEVMCELRDYTDMVWHAIADNDELLWPFSNPAYIEGFEDIPIANFTGANASKTTYRRYLSKKYGRYKMTFSGIHFNYSFDDDLLRREWSLEGKKEDFFDYKNQFYLKLAQNASAMGWLLVCLTAASPVMDSSYRENQKAGKTLYTGMSSVRCSENGYWNFFTPILNFESVEGYAKSIQRYVDMGMLYAPSELYYPIRLKPEGENSIERLINQGIDHIELRMIDLNPFFYEGIDIRDVYFAQYYLIYLASIKTRSFGEKEQVQAVAHFRNASRYNLKNVHIEDENGNVHSAIEVGINILTDMRDMFETILGSYSKPKYDEKIINPLDIIDFEIGKLTDPSNRYACRVKNEFGDDFVKKGLELAEKYKQIAHK